jgi:hypothetical protein
MKDEASILAFLKTKYGNPLFLLEARQKEMGARGPCKGSNSLVRDWLVHMSTVLYTPVELCEEHGITAAMHESALASIIKSKLNVEMTKEVTEEMCKQMTLSGFFDSSLMIPLLLKYFEKITLEFSLLVNIDAMSL